MKLRKVTSSTILVSSPQSFNHKLWDGCEQVKHHLFENFKCSLRLETFGISDVRWQSNDGVSLATNAPFLS